jgi:nucleotide-binding universal stress UspA family protein
MEEVAEMYQNILIPLDGSELAECSLEHAKAIAQGCKVADVILFRVVEPFSIQTLSALAKADDDSIQKVREQNLQDAKDYLLKVENNLKKQGIASRAVTVEGKAADAILSYTGKNNVDFIVMSTHGRSGISRFFFGSVAEKVSRHSRVPVLLLAPEGCRNIAA